MDVLMNPPSIIHELQPFVYIIVIVFGECESRSDGMFSD